MNDEDQLPILLLCNPNTSIKHIWVGYFLGHVITSSLETIERGMFVLVVRTLTGRRNMTFHFKRVTMVSVLNPPLGNSFPTLPCSPYVLTRNKRKIYYCVTAINERHSNVWLRLPIKYNMGCKDRNKRTRMNANWVNHPLSL